VAYLEGDNQALFYCLNEPEIWPNKEKMYGIVIDQQSLVHLFAILSFKRGKNAERLIMTKTVIIRYRNHESNMKTLIGYLYVHHVLI
jgi:hypothetical protein